ncbi:hypothetical protein CDAR_410401 [Caerostris darwini]|uniref:Ycf15 n=1 Tax=Caerostris darwini TaxID=1538125 RepID=A0AAV4MX24_9ARAC|nr:hypothetical protein CDAR_410401 [Caerostris darwini]
MNDERRTGYLTQNVDEFSRTTVVVFNTNSQLFPIKAEPSVPDPSTRRNWFSSSQSQRFGWGNPLPVRESILIC